MSRAQDIRNELLQLSKEGMRAAENKDRSSCLELLRKTKALVKELAELTDDDEWARLADEGEHLYRKWFN